MLQVTLANEIERGSWAQQRDALAVALGLHGLRVSEVCKARRDDLSVAGQTLQVKTLKRGRPREVPLDASIVRALLVWRAGDATEWLLFTRCRQQVYPTQFQRAARRLIAAALGEPNKFHTLRHTFATHLYAETEDPALVMRLLGHRSLASTEVYIESLKTVPDVCLLRLPTPDNDQQPPRQLRLFSPAG